VTALQKALMAHFAPEMLPRELGGTLDMEATRAQWLSKLDASLAAAQHAVREAGHPENVPTPCGGGVCVTGRRDHQPLCCRVMQSSSLNHLDRCTGSCGPDKLHSLRSQVQPPQGSANQVQELWHSLAALGKQSATIPVCALSTSPRIGSSCPSSLDGPARAQAAVPSGDSPKSGVLVSNGGVLGSSGGATCQATSSNGGAYATPALASRCVTERESGKQARYCRVQPMQPLHFPVLRSARHMGSSTALQRTSAVQCAAFCLRVVEACFRPAHCDDGHLMLRLCSQLSKGSGGPSVAW
jgi:hypothetical protein